MDGESTLPIVIALAAPCIGSFIGVVAERLPNGQSIIFSRSRCKSCELPLRWHELIPIVSWVVQRGHCRRCAARIGWATLAVELVAFAIALWALLVLPPEAWLPGLLLGWSLFLLALIDLRTMLLPDRITLPLLAAGLIVTGLLAPTRLAEHALGAAIGFASLTTLGLVYERARDRVGLGGGDAKLFAAIGAWVGWPGLPSALLIAGIAGIAHAGLRGRGRLIAGDRVPFGPALAIGGWIVWLHGPLVWS